VAILGGGYSENILILRPDRSNPDSPHVETRPLPAEMPLLKELRAFISHVRGGPPPKSSAAEAAGVVSAIAELRALAGVPQSPP
jgi:hypothetical protein